MTQKQLKNIPASIRQRLLNLAHERKDDFGLVLSQYAIERLLARLSQSSYKEQFVLKGAQLFPLWMAVPRMIIMLVSKLRKPSKGMRGNAPALAKPCLVYDMIHRPRSFSELVIHILAEPDGYCQSRSSSWPLSILPYEIPLAACL